MASQIEGWHMNNLIQAHIFGRYLEWYVMLL